MSEAAGSDSFFVGWSGHAPRPLARFLACIACAGIGGLAMLGVVLGSSVDDPGSGYIDWSGERTLDAVLTAEPYPLLHLAPDADHPHGHTVLTSGEGKYGVRFDPAAMAGRSVEAKGFMLKRGALDMLAVSDEPGIRLLPAASVAPPEAPVSLGRWRMVGEICDGKCFTGVMRYGSGLAHKACASLCLRGSLPPVFVSTGPVAGGSFFLLADRNGHAVSERYLHLVAVRIQLEGEVERRGDLLVFKADLDSAKVL